MASKVFNDILPRVYETPDEVLNDIFDGVYDTKDTTNPSNVVYADDEVLRKINNFSTYDQVRKMPDPVFAYLLGLMLGPHDVSIRYLKLLSFVFDCDASELHTRLDNCIERYLDWTKVGKYRALLRKKLGRARKLSGCTCDTNPEKECTADDEHFCKGLSSFDTGTFMKYHAVQSKLKCKSKYCLCTCQRLYDNGLDVSMCTNHVHACLLSVEQKASVSFCSEHITSCLSSSEGCIDYLCYFHKQVQRRQQKYMVCRCSDCMETREPALKFFEKQREFIHQTYTTSWDDLETLCDERGASHFLGYNKPVIDLILSSPEQNLDGVKYWHTEITSFLEGIPFDMLSRLVRQKYENAEHEQRSCLALYNIGKKLFGILKKHNEN